MKNWVLIKSNNGVVKAQRDYGDVAWGSPAYTVLGYFAGPYKDAIREAKMIKALATEQGQLRGTLIKNWHTILVLG